MDEKRKSGNSGAPNAIKGNEVSHADSLEVRRQRLDAQLRARRVAEHEGSSNKEAATGYAYAVKISSEFIAGIFVGVVLGFVFDHVLGTSPWGLIIFLVLGFCAGILNILRSAGAIAQPGAPAGKKPGERGQDEDTLSAGDET